MHTENNPLFLNEVVWRFIGRNKEKGKSMEETIRREVNRQIGVNLQNIRFLSTVEDDTTQKHYYHGQLTDAQVNNMKRDNGQTIQFYTLKELGKIPVSPSTRDFLTQHSTIFEK